VSVTRRGVWTDNWLYSTHITRNYW
jgi:hypothetical protein